MKERRKKERGKEKRLRSKDRKRAMGKMVGTAGPTHHKTKSHMERNREKAQIERLKEEE